MEKKNKGGLIAIIILLVIVVLGLVGYIAYDKGLIFNSEKEVEEKEETEEIENKEENNATNISYYTDGTYYYLILYPEVKLEGIKTAKGTQERTVNTFYLMKNEGYSTDSIEGTYEVNNGKITLNVIGTPSINYLNNAINVLTPNGSSNLAFETVSEGQYYSITLDYTSEQVLLGNFILIKK